MAWGDWIRSALKGIANGVATLDGSGKVPLAQIPTSLIGAVIFQGTWNALTNTPTLTSSVGTKGFYYVVSVAGVTNLDGITDWNVGDIAIFNGTIWEQIDNTDAVFSVNSQTGAVVLTTTDIAEGTNLYFTNAKAIAALLTGFVAAPGTVTAADSIRTAIQKLAGNVATPSFSGQVRFNGIIVPSTISGAVDNYNPTGLATCNTIRQGLSANATVSGLAAQPDGTLIILTNTSTLRTLTLLNNSILSSGANRFIMTANLILGVNQSCMIQYDGTNSRWRLISGN